ncbi:leucine-rich repeat-containing protein 70 [Phascolarctos cinereus]
MYLQLDRNRIISIDGNTFETVGASLKILNLSFNNLTDLRPRVLKSLSSLIHLQASYNPWDHSCKLLSLRDWLTSLAITLNIYCQNPPSMHGRALHYIKSSEFADTSPTNGSPAWAVESLQIHHTTMALMMAWHKLATFGKHFEKSETESVTFRGRVLTSTPSRFFQEHVFENPSETTTELPVQIQLNPVNLSMENSSVLPTNAGSLTQETALICTQEVEKLNQAFDILLVFFILACGVIIFLIFKIIQFKQKLKTQENSGEHKLEYYSFYQSARYSVTEPLCARAQNPLGRTVMEQVGFPKQIMPESQAQVILFEHSAL